MQCRHQRGNELHANGRVWGGFMHRRITFYFAPAGYDPGPIMKFGTQSVKLFSVTNA